MKNFGRSFIISLACTALAAVAFYLEYYVIAAFLCWPAFLFNAMEIKSYGSLFQCANFRIHTLLLGYIVDVATGQPYYLYTALGFTLSFAGVLRLEFFKSWGFTKFYWTEALALVAAYGIYVYAGLQNPGDWRGWVLPLFPLLFMTMIGSGVVKDGIRLNKQGEAKLNSEAGQPAMDFSLPDSQGSMVNLSDFKNKNHVLLLFVRGDWCPTCHIMMRIYEKNREKFIEKEVVALGISPDNSEVNTEMIKRLGWKNMVLTDSDQQVTKTYGGKFFANGPETKYPEGIPLPASVLIDKSGFIRYVSSPGKANEFLDPSHIFPIVGALN